MKHKYKLAILLLLLLSKTGYTQTSSFQIGTQVPLMYSVGYNYETKNKVALNMQAGVLTRPYDQAILQVLKKFGTNEVLVNTIGEAFDYGLIVQPSIKYNFNSYYAGITYSSYTLVARETPKNAIESYYGVRMPPGVNSSPLRVQSHLSNAGLLFGRKFGFDNSKVELLLEFSLQKTFYSKSNVSAKYSGVAGCCDSSSLNNMVDKELNDYYLEYGYLPSINIFLLIPL